jgi:hypothetical protein
MMYVLKIQKSEGGRRRSHMVYFSMLSMLRLYGDDTMSNECEITNWQGKWKYPQKTCHSAMLSTINPK